MTETALVKVKVDETMIERTVFIAMQDEAYSVSEYGEPVAVKFMPGVDYRSIEQNNLYWKCLELLAENKSDNPDWNTKDKCMPQVRWGVKFIDRESAVHFVDKNGNSRLYFELKSISFAKSRRNEANLYYSDAFQFIAEALGITAHELIAEAESRMKGRRICRMCGSVQKIQTHHVFSNTKQNRELYGKLIDDPRNTIDLCADCHMVKSVPKMTEAEFCKALGIEIRSKSGRGAA